MFEQVSVENHSDETLRFKGRLLPKLPDHYTEPSIHNVLIVPHGAMPANPYLDEAVKKQQSIIDAEYLKLYETPPKDMPHSFVEDVVIADFVINEERRKMENFEGYMEFTHSGMYVDPILTTEKELFERGQATIDEAIHFVVNCPLKKGEFGKVTHPYGYRMQQLEPFRTEMNEAIEAQGGIVYPSVAPYRSINILPKIERFDNGTEFGGQRIIGFIVKYKRDYGHVPIPGNDTEVLRIVERQIAAYRVDEASGFDQSVLDAMYELRNTYPKRIDWGRQAGDSAREKKIYYDRLKKTGCVDFIENAVQTDALDDFVVPISTTIYGYKEKLPVRPIIDHVARTALEAALYDAFDSMPGAYKE
jgi:hypothetical protein